MQDRRLEIIQRLMPRVPERRQQTPEHAMLTWWANIRRDGGMRLTDLGYEIMHDVLGLESWELDLRDQDKTIFTKRLIVDLDRKLEWPYYIEVNVKRKRRRIVFFGSREAMMATIYGDLGRWLSSMDTNAR
jgi:hypothetical protein